MLNLYDVVVSSVIMACFFSGLRQGAVRLLLGNISFVFSILLSFVLFPASRAVVEEYVESQAIAFGLASCISYIISLILCSVFFSKIKLVIKPMCGGMIDKSIGSLLGVFNGLFLSLLVFVVAAFFAAPKPLQDYRNLYSVISTAKHDNYPRWLKNSSSFPFMRDFLALSLQYPCVINLLKKTDLQMPLSIPSQSPRKSEEESQEIDQSLGDELDKLLDYD